jgi:hypothetical protein
MPRRCNVFTERRERARAIGLGGASTGVGIAAYLDAAGRPRLAQGLHEAASNAFFDGFQIAVLVAVAITLMGALAAAMPIPTQAPETACEPIEIIGPLDSPQRP